MATLAEHINTTKKQSQERLTFVKSASQLNISAEVDLRSSEFHSLKVAVCKFPLVFAAGASEEGPLVLDYNFDKLGRIECGYTPKVIVLSGIKAAKDAKQKARGDHKVLNATAWVGTKAFKTLQIMASDVSSNDLQALLYKAVQKAYGKRSESKATSSAYYVDSPYIADVYMFDNYCILGWQGQKFRQRYTFDQTTRNLTLDGDMTPVVETYEDAPLAKVTASSFLDEGNRGTTQGGFDGRQSNVFDSWKDFGAPNSEANNPAIKLMLNVEEALKCYLQEILKGVWKVVYSGVAVTPPNMIHAAMESKIAAKEAKVKNFSVVDFLQWQNKKLNIKAAIQTKLVDGDAYGYEDFAYIGIPRDISTWFVPLKTSGQIHAAKRKDIFAGVPKSEQKAVKIKVQAFGTTLSGKPTKNQPHKFVMNADEPDKDMCKSCSRSGAHPIHKVK